MFCLGILQVMWLAHSIPVTIHMHCSRPGFDLYNRPILVQQSQNIIHILWVDLKNKECTTPNHIVPLLPTDAKGNNYIFSSPILHNMHS
jgi:hypothetical protein